MYRNGLVFTEHLICLNGYEGPGANDRAEGVGAHLERMATYLVRAGAA